MTTGKTYSIIITSFKDTCFQTVEKCIHLRRGPELNLELICVDNTKDGRHRNEIERLF